MKNGCFGCLGLFLLVFIPLYIVNYFHLDKINKGIAYYEKGNYEKAEDTLSSVKFSSVDEASEVIGIYYLSNIYKQNGDEEKHINHLLLAYNALIDKEDLQKEVNEYKAGSIADKIINEPFEAYEQGNYSVAKSFWADNKKILEPKNPKTFVACYYLSEIYKQEGNEQDSLNCKITVYNSLVNNADLCNEVDEFKAGMSSTILNDSSIAALKREQERARQKKELEDYSIFADVKAAIQEIAHNPYSVNVISKEIVASKVHITSKNEKLYYYLIKTRCTGSNAFGATVSSWYIVEIAVTPNREIRTRHNIQSFDYEPKEQEISICKALFGGW